MTTTLLDPRLELCRQRKEAIAKLATLRMYSHTLCGCRQCGDAERIEELRALITRAEQAVDELNNLICQRVETPCTP